MICIKIFSVIFIVCNFSIYILILICCCASWMNHKLESRLPGGREVQEGGHIRAHLWLTHVDVYRKPTQYCKAIIFQFKIYNFQKTKILSSGPIISWKIEGKKWKQ